jgi:hypothetical protein
MTEASRNLARCKCHRAVVNEGICKTLRVDSRKNQSIHFFLRELNTTFAISNEMSNVIGSDCRLIRSSAHEEKRKEVGLDEVPALGTRSLKLVLQVECCEALSRQQGNHMFSARYHPQCCATWMTGTVSARYRGSIGI